MASSGVWEKCLSSQQMGMLWKIILFIKLFNLFIKLFYFILFVYSIMFIFIHDVILTDTHMVL